MYYELKSAQFVESQAIWRLYAYLNWASPSSWSIPSYKCLCMIQKCNLVLLKTSLGILSTSSREDLRANTTKCSLLRTEGISKGFKARPTKHSSKWVP